MFELVLNPGADGQKRLRFTVSEGDIDDAVDYGRAQRDDPLDQQMNDAAYHMVLETRVADAETVCDVPWVLLRSGKIIGRNAHAAQVREDDLA